jgi:hypothetical protein
VLHSTRRCNRSRAAPGRVLTLCASRADAVSVMWPFLKQQHNQCKYVAAGLRKRSAGSCVSGNAQSGLTLESWRFYFVFYFCVSFLVFII